jgi:glycosyltransferase involved in cell wall biosynthesis
VTPVAYLSRPRMALISDVSLGYGTPQLLRMADSFARIFGAEVHIFEPDEPERRPVDIRQHARLPHIHLTRIYTAAHPHVRQGRIEYCTMVAERVKALSPDILMFATMYGISILDHLDTRRVLKIFYCLEEVDPQYEYLFPLARKCEIIIFPEDNRARIYLRRLGDAPDDRDVLLIYNTGDRNEWTEPDARMDRIFYGGTFDRKVTFGSYYLHSDVKGLPIDIYGIIRGFKDPTAAINLLDGREGGAKFCGYQQSDDAFFKLLSRYLYSIVIWNPDREDRLYAAPNKFFDALACGVPPIAAPHPQCAEIIRKWKCGILMDDWSFGSFKTALQRALKAAKSDYYRELAANCRRAMETELSWDRQFDKLTPLVERRLARLGRQPVLSS